MKLLLAIFALLHPAMLIAACSPPPVEQTEEKLKESEAAAKASPMSDRAKFELAQSLLGTASSLKARGKPADIETAITHTSRALKISEELLKAAPKSQEVNLMGWQNAATLGELLDRRGQPGDKEKAFGYRLRGLAFAEALYKENPNPPNHVGALRQSYYAMVNQYGARDAVGDRATAYEHGVKLFKLIELHPNVGVPGVDWVAHTAWQVAGLAEKAGKSETKQWRERAYDLFAAIEKSKAGLSPQEKSWMEEFKKKLGK